MLLPTYYCLQVRWDGDDARELSLEWLRGKCGYVPQELDIDTDIDTDVLSLRLAYY